MHTVLDLLIRRVDQGLDFLGGVCGTLGQFANFLSDDCKALARLTRTRGFNTGIERQKVGLEGNVIDDADDVADLAGGLFDRFHGLNSLLDDLAGLFCALTGAGNEVACFGGAAGGVLHRGGDLFQSGCGFLDGSSLLLGALGKIVGSRLDLGRTGLDAAGIFCDLFQCTLQLCSRGVEVTADTIKRCRKRLFDTVGDVAIGKLAQRLSEIVDGEFDVGSFAGLGGFALDAFLFRQAAVVVGFLFQAGALESVVTEDFDGFGHLADFVLSVETIDCSAGIAGGKRRHTFAKARHRSCDTLLGDRQRQHDSNGDTDQHADNRELDGG
ncbi:hypothetical protein D3C71_934760 [compost metagenome]